MFYLIKVFVAIVLATSAFAEASPGPVIDKRATSLSVCNIPPPTLPAGTTLVIGGPLFPPPFFPATLNVVNCTGTQTCRGPLILPPSPLPPLITLPFLGRCS